MALLGYWISNILGFLLMHYGYVQLRGHAFSLKKNWKNYLLATTAYTVLIALLIVYGILPSVNDIKELLDNL